MKLIIIILFISYFNLNCADWKALFNPTTDYYFAIISQDSSTYLFSNDDKEITIYKANRDGILWSQIYFLPKNRIVDFDAITVDVLDENTIFLPTIFNNQINRISFNPFSGTASKINSEFAIDNIKMIDFNRGIAGHNSQIFITKDSWINCNTIKVSGLQSFWYTIDETISYVSTNELGQTEYLTSTDDGISWQTTKVGDFTAKKLYFKNDNLGFITGTVIETNLTPTTYTDIIYRTSDGGKTWLQVLNNKRINRSELSDIVFKDAKLGITTGTSNSVYITNDGGLTWQKQDVEPLNGVNIRSSHCGYTESRFMIAVERKGLFYIDMKKIK